MKKRDVEKDVLSEILKTCNLYERIVIKTYSSIYIKVYKKGFQDGFNWWNNK